MDGSSLNFPNPFPMDCRNFRNNHLSYLDDTLSGDMMTAAQRHILACDRCAAHDTMVRRSLLLARNIPMLEPSAEFKARLRTRLEECKANDSGFARSGASASAAPSSFRAPRVIAAGTVGLAMLGSIAWGGFSASETPLVAMQPVLATVPATPQTPYVSTAMMQAMATGNPVWPAAMILDEMPTQFVNASYSFSEGTR